MESDKGYIKSDDAIAEIVLVFQTVFSLYVWGGGELFILYDNESPQGCGRETSRNAHEIHLYCTTMPQQGMLGQISIF